MGKTLIIAEKPSVATDIARALGGFTKQKDFFESDTCVLSSAVGHLLELCPPAEYEVKRGKWTFAHLPVIPPSFDLQPIAKTEARLKLLARLIRRKDVEKVINACDAGREGELIFRYILQHTKNKKPIHRLWLQSMTPTAIREGFTHLRSGEEMQPLADAAICRSESDWLVGINGTRALTAFNSKTGGFQLTTVGRVQTPTLAIVVDREEKIRKFKPRDYWEVHATFQVEAGEYVGRWFDPTFVKDKKAGDPELRAERHWDRARVEAIRDRCLHQPGEVTEESKPSTQAPPLLYDLTSLQREANGRFGFSARRTLQLAQALYERHKVLTYPRTDSRALPEDYQETVRHSLQAMAGSEYQPFAGHILEQNWVRPNRRVFNNAKVSDHFAIVPTSIAPKKLKEEEAKLYDMVMRRFLAVFYPSAEYLITTRLTRVAEDNFRTDGKVLVKPGWLAVYGRTQRSSGEADLTPVKPQETVQTKEVEIKDFQTRPPARFTEATLLSAMEGAGKLVEDEELREAMSTKGLGTPATRAAIIEGLIAEKYMLRQGRELQPTAKAFSLITLLKGLNLPELCSPEMTGDWEFKLKQMEQGRLPRPEFMGLIARMTRKIVDTTKLYESDTVPGDFATLQSPCPKCGGQVKENYKKFQCQACDFALWKIVANRQFEIEEMEQLLSEKKVGLLEGFRSKQGRPFSASILLTDEFKAEFDFGQNQENQDGTAAEIDFTGQQPLGKCPKCGASVFENDRSYLCEKAVGKDRACDFRSGKVILQRPIEHTQMEKLLTAKKTDLLHKFISKKGRPFSAFLVVRPDGTVGFEFAPRTRAPKKAAKSEEKESGTPAGE